MKPKTRKTLRHGIQEYVAMKRAMGFSFVPQERRLIRFCQFMADRGKERIQTHLAKEWALGKDQDPTWKHARELSTIRAFAVHWKTIEPKSEVWPQDLWPMRYERGRPYIYREEEISSILEACQKLEPKKGIRSHGFYTLFGLIATCGLRLSEATRLPVNDVDLDRGIITIRRTKFNKTRAIPVHATTLQALRRYWSKRQKYHPRCQLSEFFITNRERRIQSATVEWTFNKLAMESGVRKESWRGPRIHDLRHTFIMRTIEQWYRDGKDVEALLPILSTYVGHANPGSTYWYMTLTPELMALAKNKLDLYMGGLNQ